MFNTFQGLESQSGYSSGSQPRIGNKGATYLELHLLPPPQFNASRKPKYQGGYGSELQPCIGTKGDDIPVASEAYIKL
jgi:hypothetical protein